MTAKQIFDRILNILMRYLKDAVRFVLAKIGCRIIRIPKSVSKRHVAKLQDILLYVGCEADRRKGFVHCDVRPLPGVDLVCRAWEISRYCSGVREIYSRHMLEHLTIHEADATLKNWFKALRVGGKVHLVVPNLDYHIDQFKRAKWNEQAFADKWSDACWGYAGLYGWQRECDPTAAEYNQTYWDVHKSGYVPEMLTFFLARAGFSNIEVIVEDKVHLVAKAIKSGERQVAPSLDGISQDHCERYLFAAKHLPKNSRVLDVACGVGYGAKLLAETGFTQEVLAIDCDQGAVEYAREHYSHPCVRFEVGDAMHIAWEEGQYDAVVSLETIEHLRDAKGFLYRLAAALRPDGILVCSTPNEDCMPFDAVRFPYHFRHYRLQDIRLLLEGAGFIIESVHSQRSASECQIEIGADGAYLILVARRSVLVPHCRETAMKNKKTLCRLPTDRPLPLGEGKG